MVKGNQLKKVIFFSLSCQNGGIVVSLVDSDEKGKRGRKVLFGRKETIGGVLQIWRPHFSVHFEPAKSWPAL